MACGLTYCVVLKSPSVASLQPKPVNDWKISHVKKNEANITKSPFMQHFNHAQQGNKSK